VSGGFGVHDNGYLAANAALCLRAKPAVSVVPLRQRQVIEAITAVVGHAREDGESALATSAWAGLEHVSIPLEIVDGEVRTLVADDRIVAMQAVVEEDELAGAVAASEVTTEVSREVFAVDPTRGVAVHFPDLKRVMAAAWAVHEFFPRVCRWRA
jgi:hypothetical protein